MAKENLVPETAQALNIERGFDISSAELRTDVAIEKKPEVFKKNILFLIKQRGMKKASIAEEADVPPEWLRQLTSRGLSQIRRGSKDYLERLRRFFLLDSVSNLWSELLIDEIKQTEHRAVKMYPFLRSKDWPYAWKVLTLLQTGEYDFLRGLIDKSYSQETARGAKLPRDDNKEVKASAKDMAAYRRSRQLGQN